MHIIDLRLEVGDKKFGRSYSLPIEPKEGLELRCNFTNLEQDYSATIGLKIIKIKHFENGGNIVCIVKSVCQNDKTVLEILAKSTNWGSCF